MIIISGDNLLKLYFGPKLFEYGVLQKKEIEIEFNLLSQSLFFEKKTVLVRQGSNILH